MGESSQNARLFDCNDDSDVDKEYLPDSSPDTSRFVILNIIINLYFFLFNLCVCSSDQEIMEGRGHIITAEDGEGETKEKKNVRKRTRNPKSWACNVRKKAHDEGKEYMSVRKKLVPAKGVLTKKNCLTSCVHGCQKFISDQERNIIFQNYYTLDEQAKKLFLLTTFQKFLVERHRKGKNAQNSRRKNTFRYYFNVSDQRIEVCKLFYLGTLCISQTPIYNVHLGKDIVSNTPKESRQGRHVKHSINDDDKTFLKRHIESFPKVESHYCRANNSREYLESNLSIAKMYSLYVDLCKSENKQPVKESFYRHVFSNEYNLFFHTPKKDRCDLCEEVKLQIIENRLSTEKNEEYSRHSIEKGACRNEKNTDKEDENTVILCFDLQNVLSCPRAEISSFYYRSKFNVYNLTAILSSTKKVYCAVWHEMFMGRSGNDIASAVVTILERVFDDNPNLTNLVLWSDSCVPQNRNSLMSYAVSYFLQEHPNLGTITMKFSTPGHSCVQEIDSVHSAIERVLKKSEYFSPVSLIRLLLKVNLRKPYCIIQMKARHFKDFKACTGLLDYKKVPYSKVKCLKFTQSFFELEYKTSYIDKNWTKINLKSSVRTRTASVSIVPTPKPADVKNSISAEKISAIKAMMNHMPEVDRQYYTTILKL